MPSRPVLLLAALLWLHAGADGPPPPPSECQRTCGGLDIPYPFGVGPDNCSISPDFFHLYCNDTGNGVHKLFLDGTVEVLNISLPLGQARVLNHISFSCYNATSETEEDIWHWRLSNTFWFSNTSNKFTVVGCRTLAFINAGTDSVDSFTTGCVAICDGDNPTLLSDGTCSGMGCCQTAVPRGLRYYDVGFDDRFNTSGLYNTTPCSYAVLMESSSFTFSTSYLTSRDFNNSNDGRVPVVLDWAVGNETCEVARTKPRYACVSSNSECFDAASGPGYICICTKGFQGNPYLTGAGGCQGRPWRR